MSITNGRANGNAPDIVFYTSHICPWAHRVHIALAELGLPFKEEIIDLAVPRTAEYLKINPRGLVPTLVYNGEIIPESAIIVQFLADLHPSHLVKASSEPGGALERARINFFVDTFFTKVQTHLYPQLTAKTDEEKNEKMVDFINAIVKEIEPLLQDAAPFFGGSRRLTLAEVLTSSFILRYWSFPKHGLLPSNLLSELETKTPHFFRWANTVVAEKNVHYIWNEERVADVTKKRVAKMAVAAK